MRAFTVARSEIDASPGRRLDTEYWADRKTLRGTSPRSLASTSIAVSARMSRQRTEGTEPELRLRRLARSMGLHYRCNRRNISGRPDLSNDSGGRWMVFMNGCFWHAHGHLPPPAGANAYYWEKKFKDNRARDARWIRAHRKCGWNVAVVWECRTDEQILATLRWVTRRSGAVRSSEAPHER